MEFHAVQTNEIVCNIPEEGSEKSINIDETSRDTQLVSSYADKVKEIFVCVSNKEGTSVRCLKKKLLVLDVNGVLADIAFPPPKGYKADAIVARRALFKRPFYLEFLKFCFENFEVAVWTSRIKKNVDRILDHLIGDMRDKLLFCWDYSHCTQTSFGTLENKHKPLVFKDLRKIWEKHDPNLPWEKGYFNETNTLLLDDSPYKALLNPPHTCIFPHTFGYQNKLDNSLAAGGDLREYLEGLLKAGNMAEYVEQNPFGQERVDERSASWKFYLEVIDSLKKSCLSA